MTKSPTRRRVILESPYRGFDRDDRLDNIDYARTCLRDSINRGEAPIASHLLYTQQGVLDDNNPNERNLGIECGLAWLPVSSLSVFYTDRGWSSGMLYALHNHNLKSNYPFRLRSLSGRHSVKLPATLDEDIEDLLRNYIED